VRAHAGSAWCREHMLLRRGRGSDALGVLAGASLCPRRPSPPRTGPGNGEVGFADGRGEACCFNFPDGIALAANDCLGFRGCCVCMYVYACVYVCMCACM
jgi:hypothetical protein